MSAKKSNTSSEFMMEALKGIPLSEQVYEKIKKGIIQGQLEAGTRLTETDVAQQMGVSPTPVREAFRRLASEGFVEIIPWRGVIVRSITEKELLETYQCREMMEGLSCRLAAANITQKGINQLKKLLQESKDAATASEIVECNSSIHNLIIEFAGNSKLQSILGLFHDVIFRDRTLTAYNAKRREEINAEHEAILTALQKHDGDLAEEAMRIHVRNGLSYRRNSNK